jgi:hypothetical protein
MILRYGPLPQTEFRTKDAMAAMHILHDFSETIRDLEDAGEMPDPPLL